jgi:hypothetical protein
VYLDAVHVMLTAKDGDIFAYGARKFICIKEQVFTNSETFYFKMDALAHCNAQYNPIYVATDCTLKSFVY